MTNSTARAPLENRPPPAPPNPRFGLTPVQWALLGCFGAYLAAVSFLKVDSFEHYLRLYQAESGGPSRMVSLHVFISSGVVFAAAIMMGLARLYLREAGGEARFRVFSASMIFSLVLFALDARLRVTAHTAAPLGDVLYAILHFALVLPLVAYREQWAAHPFRRIAAGAAIAAGILVMVVDLASADGTRWRLWIEEGLRATAGVAWALFAWSVLAGRMRDNLSEGGGRGLAVMWGVIAALVAAGFWAGLVADGSHPRLEREFHLDGEWTIPAFASSLLLVTGAVLAAVVAIEAGAAGSRWRWHWVVLAAGLAYMSVDETAGLHEMWGGPVKRFLPLDGTIFHFAWVVVAIPLVLALAVYFWPMLWKLPACDRNRLIAAGVVYVGGAVGMELVGGAIFGKSGSDSAAFQLSVVCEEGLELVGLGLLVRALVLMLRSADPGPAQPAPVAAG